MPVSKEPDPIDVEVGQRLRATRNAVQMSQERLGELIGITFQQVQKYEKGTNRIAASRLVRVCRVLGCEPTDLLPPIDQRHVGKTAMQRIVEENAELRDRIKRIGAEATRLGKETRSLTAQHAGEPEARLHA